MKIYVVIDSGSCSGLFKTKEAAIEYAITLGWNKDQDEVQIEIWASHNGSDSLGYLGDVRG